MKILEIDLDAKRFFLANQVANAYEKILKATKPLVLSLVESQTIYYTLDKNDQAAAPEVITAGTPLRAIKSSKKTRRFVRPCDSRAGLNPKQIAAISVFDAKYVDAAVTAGVISQEQAKQISLASDETFFPLVQPVK